MLLYVKAFVPVADPPGAVITMFTEPADARAGVTAVIEVSEFTVNDAAGVPPKVTAVAPVNPVPEIVTVVCTNTGPDAGVTFVNVGAAM